MSEPSPDTTTQLMESLTREMQRLRSELTGVTIDPEAGLLDAGYLDSLSATELLSHVEEVYGVYVAADRLVGDLYSLRALADGIANNRPEAA